MTNLFNPVFLDVGVKGTAGDTPMSPVLQTYLMVEDTGFHEFSVIFKFFFVNVGKKHTLKMTSLYMVLRTTPSYMKVVFITYDQHPHGSTGCDLFYPHSSSTWWCLSTIVHITKVLQRSAEMQKICRNADLFYFVCK